MVLLSLVKSLSRVLDLQGLLTCAEKFEENASPSPQVAASQAETKPKTVHFLQLGLDEPEKAAVSKSNKPIF